MARYWCINTFQFIIYWILLTSFVYHVTSLSATPCSWPIAKDRTFSVKCAGNNSKSGGGKASTGCAITVKCQAGFAIDESKDTLVSVCQQGQWEPKIPDCRKICRKWKPINLELTCFTKEMQKVNCTRNLLSGAQIRQRCARNYHAKTHVNYDRIICDKYGEWDNPLHTCVPLCGKIFTNPVPQITGGVKEQFGNAPWHVAIYNGQKVLNCGGTIISNQVVLSAAHCFFDNAKSVPKNASSFEVVVAKVTRNYYKKDNKFQKVYKVKQILYPEFYHGLETNYVADIALLHLSEEIQMSSVVLQACIKLSNPISNLPDRTMGKISGWGSNDLDKHSEILLTTNISFLNYETCVKQFSIDERDSIHLDKFCVTATEDSTSAVQQGDSGGGFVYFRSQSSSYYVLGVVSVKFDSRPSIGVFTSIKLYADWMKTTLMKLGHNNDEEQESPELSTSCPVPNHEIYNILQIDCRKNNSFNQSEFYIPELCAISLKCINLGIDASNTKNQEFQLECIDGNWNPQLPSCQEIEECTTSTNLPGICTTLESCPWFNSTNQNSSLVVPNSTCIHEGNNKQDPKICCARCGKVKGTSAELNTWPWIVKLIHRNYLETGIYCMGSLISDQWVMTTASYLGYMKFVQVNDPFSTDGKRIRILDRVNYPTFKIRPTRILSKYKAIDDDIALIKLVERVNFGANVGPICILNGNNKYKSNEFYIGKRAFISGRSVNTTYVHLEERSMYIINQDECSQSYHSLGIIINGNKIMCAGDEKSNTCEGDSGGPLVMQIENTYYAVGIVSQGTTNCDLPTIFTKVSHYADWISETTGIYVY